MFEAFLTPYLYGLAFTRTVLERGYNPFVSLAPQFLQQPINPDWNFGTIFNIDNTNSKSPETEKAIVSQLSYGRQIGVTMDAVNSIIDNCKCVNRGDDAVREFKKVHTTVQTVKTREVKRRLQRVTRDLDRLKEADPIEYELVVADIEAGIGKQR